MPEPTESALTKWQREMKHLSALAVSDPEAAKELKERLAEERDRRERDQKNSEREAEARIDAERARFRERVATLRREIPTGARYFGPEHDWVQRLALFDQTLPVFPGRPDDSGATASSFASATSHIPVWLLARTMLALQRDEHREIWRPTIPEVQRCARGIVPWLAASGREVFAVARYVVGQPDPRADPMIEWPEYGDGFGRIESGEELPRLVWGGGDGEGEA